MSDLPSDSSPAEESPSSTAGDSAAAKSSPARARRRPRRSRRADADAAPELPLEEGASAAPAVVAASSPPAAEPPPPEPAVAPAAAPEPAAVERGEGHGRRPRRNRGYVDPKAPPLPPADYTDAGPPAPAPKREEVPVRFSADPDDEVPTSFSADPDEPAEAPAATPAGDAKAAAEARPAGGPGLDRPERPEPGDRPHRGDRPDRNDRNDRQGRHGGGRPFDKQQGGGRPFERERERGPQGGGGRPQDPRQGGGPPPQGKKGPFPQQGGGRPFEKPARPFDKGPRKGGKPFRTGYGEPDAGIPLEVGNLPEDPHLQEVEAMAARAAEIVTAATAEPVELNRYFGLPLPQLVQEAVAFGATFNVAPNRHQVMDEILRIAQERKLAIFVEGILEIADEGGFGLIVYQHENYKIKPLNAFVPAALIKRYGLQRGHILRALVQPKRKIELPEGTEPETCPHVLRLESVMGLDPAEIPSLTPFEDLTPYYPTSRILLESIEAVKWDNLSMRVVDLLTPIGFGQRGLIVAPPRTGKTILQQGIANAIQSHYKDAHLIILLIDERPEEVTDFRRQVHGEVISSTFDEAAENHVHCAEMVIEKARRMVEVGQHVVILLDSITRLARAYNALMPSSGKILSGGVEATALQKPKRFFGSARNIEGGGSLTIIGTALVETGSKMDEVIFEEFKGTGNMELHLDRGLVDKRIFPSINLEKSGTRKEELLYHPDELLKIYSLRRAMKGVPPVEAMEMLIVRVKKTKSNAEFLLGLSR